MKDKQKAIVIGAGIVGLATARALAIRGYSVQVFDRSSRAVGASIRNFGMIWPIGQPAGELYHCAMRSREIWTSISGEGGFWHDPVGSLHLAYHRDEWQVLQELFEAFREQGRDIRLLDAEETTALSPATQPKDLLGSLYSREEVIVDPRQAIAALPEYLEEKYDIQFTWGKCVSYISEQTVFIGNEEEHEADVVFVCSGPDLETLYPEIFLQYPFTKCKLQMMRLGAQPEAWRIGPALCGGLSLIHYNSFKVAASLPELQKRYARQMAPFIQWGIHVMVSQNQAGELTIGDSHEYGHSHDPFDREEINQLITGYLRGMARFKDWSVIQSWNGIYPKLTNGETNLFCSPEPGVYILNGLGGAGMTLSFGLAEQVADKL